MVQEKRLYIAYGSNLNMRDMTRRCPTATVAGAAELKDHELVFRRHATVEPREGASVPVGVWEIQPEDEKRLDMYEGYPYYYGKEIVEVELEAGTVSAMVYTMTPGHRPELPDCGYLEVIKEGYREFGLDWDAVDKALERTIELIQEMEQAGPEPGSFPSMKM